MKPFLKWAGNKYQIIERIKTLLPNGKNLIEPFVGSGAVFLNTQYSNYLLADNNQDLIVLYQYLQKDGKDFIDYSKKFFEDKNNTENMFYELREQFNLTQDFRLKSALFIYLNKHCFNGLCRYNAKGYFNTPFGKYKKPYFPEKEMVFFHEKSKNAVFQQADFVEIMHSAKSGDIVYCDPPYVPLSKTANFTSYSTGGFGKEQQVLLAKTAEELKNRGVAVIISNHDTVFTREIYNNAKVISFDVQRFISCNGQDRSKAKEILAVFE